MMDKPDNSLWEVGKWYSFPYGMEHPIGRCVAANNKFVVLSFRWGAPVRSWQSVRPTTPHVEVPDPRWFGLIRLFKAIADALLPERQSNE